MVRSVVYEENHVHTKLYTSNCNPLHNGSIKLPGLQTDLQLSVNGGVTTDLGINIEMSFAMLVKSDKI